MTSHITYPKSMAIVLALIAVCLCACTQDDSPARAAYFAEDLKCPAPSKGQFDSWGKSGSSHSCKINHGPFVAFEQGYVQLRGQYDNGKEIGIWRWYDKDGKVLKEIDYARQ